MFMAGLVPRTKNLSFGTAVICLPNHHPVKVAAEVAQFDHMSRGRFMFGIGVGGLFSDFELFGNGDRKVRERKAMESIGMIERIWAQDPPYDLTGEFWNVQIKDAISEMQIFIDEFVTKIAEYYGGTSNGRRNNGNGDRHAEEVELEAEAPPIAKNSANGV